VLLVSAVVLTIVNITAFLGIFDGRMGDPRKGFADSLYASFQLFTISLDRPPSNVQLPLTLQITRFIAPLITAGTVWSLVASVAGAWVSRRRAARWRGHEVICGSGPVAEAIAVGLARNSLTRDKLRRPKVAFISDRIDPEVRGLLEAHRVLAIETSVVDIAFGSIVQHASDVTVVFESDDDTLRWATAVERAVNLSPQENQCHVTALFARPPKFTSVTGSRIRFASLADRISRGVIQIEELEPVASGSCVAVVIGEGEGASSLANCLAATGSSHVSQRVRRVWSELDKPGVVGGRPDGHNWATDLVGDVIAQIDRLRQDEVVGSPIYIWSDNVGRDLSLAFELSVHWDDQRFVVVAPRFNDGATASRSGEQIGSRIRIINSTEALVIGHVRAVEPVVVIAQLLGIEREKNGCNKFHATEGPNALDELIDAGYSENDVAASIFEAIASLNLLVTSFDGSSLQFSPKEIRQIARALYRLSQPNREPVLAEIYPYVVLVGRLPKIFQAASLKVVPSGAALARVRLTDELAADMAREISQQYVLRSGSTPSLTPAEAGEADIDQALDFSVKVAACGYAFVPLDEGTIHHLDEPSIEILAEFEHHRWCRHRRERGWSFGPERDNARRIHPDLIPWGELSEAVKDLDRGPVRDIPHVLENVRLGLKQLDQTS